MSTRPTVATATQPSANTTEKSGGCPVCGYAQITPFLSAPDRFHLRSEKYTLARCSFCACVWLMNPPLPAEPLAKGNVFAEGGRDQLQGDRSVEGELRGAVDHAHAPVSEHAVDTEVRCDDDAWLKHAVPTLPG